MDDTQEIWYPIPGYEGYYEASSFGRLRSLGACFIHPYSGKTQRKGKVLSQSVKKNRYSSRYMTSIFSIAGKHKTVMTHQCVCAAFNGPRPERMVAAHINGNSLDNRAINLQWVTCKENTAHMVAHGTARHGEKHHNAKLTAEKVLRIRTIAAEGVGATEISKRFNVSRASIRSVIIRKTWADVR